MKSRGAGRLSEAFISLFVALIFIIIQFQICEFFGRFIIRMAKIIPRSSASRLSRHGIYFNLIHIEICYFFSFICKEKRFFYNLSKSI